MSDKPTLVLICKRPKLNQGKQRLSTEISKEDTFAIANALLDCAIEDAIAWQGQVVIACSEHKDVAWAKTLLNDVKVIAQLPEGKEGNLGDRLNFVDTQLRLQGYNQIVYIGTDAPMLTKHHYKSTLTALHQSDIVLSHAEDGGVVIMANNKPWPVLTDLPWSTSDLSYALSSECNKNHLSVEYSLPGYDVDHVSDLKKILIDLKTDSRPARISLLNQINKILSSPKVKL